MSVNFTKQDEAFMSLALEEARRAAEEGDVPVSILFTML